MSFNWTEEEQEFMKQQQENVQHPSHYNGTKNECIKIMELLFGKKKVKVWCELNIFKYRWRSYLKNGEEDINKSVWYEDYALKLKKKMKKKRGKKNKHRF